MGFAPFSVKLARDKIKVDFIKERVYMQTWQLIAWVAGALGFILSAINLFWQIHLTYQRVVITGFRAHTIVGNIDDVNEVADIGIGLLVSFTVTNKSSRNIPIISTSLIFDGNGSPWYSKLDTSASIPFIGSTSLNEIPYPIADTCLPDNIPPHCSKRMSLLFCTHGNNDFDNWFCNREKPIFCETPKKVRHLPHQHSLRNGSQKLFYEFAITLNTATKKLLFAIPKPEDVDEKSDS
jgi:hypothetical protein